MGFAAPFVLPAKRLLQQLCKDKVGWDEEIPQEALDVWERWLNDLPKLVKISVPRCFKPSYDAQLRCIQLHHFAGALFDGYGVVSYLRFTDTENRVHCSLVMGKSRVALIKPTTIPRLELTAATVVLKQDVQIREELDLKIQSVLFWTDSTCVLQYINNEASRFKTFVANRIAIIHENSSPSQWRYMYSKVNPADFASRGLQPCNEQEINLWINGPEFLRKDEPSWPVHPKGVNVLPDEDLEWKRKVEIYETQVRKDHLLDSFIQYYSSWYGLLKGIAWLLRFLGFIQNACDAKDSQEAIPSPDASQHRVIGAGKQPLTVGKLQTAKIRLIRYIQGVEFPDEVARLESNPKGAHRTGCEHSRHLLENMAW